MMDLLCDTCGRKPAEYHVTEVRDGNAETYGVCVTCRGAKHTGGCPKCGFSYKYDGISCGHCGEVNAGGEKTEVTVRKKRGVPRKKLRTERSTILAPLGLYGLHEVENAILAGLATGEPFLLVGSHGSAKTLLAPRVAETLGFRYHAYDASKAMFEDLIGFPDPSGLVKGEVRYARTPLSIYDKEFVLIDEISLASPTMQSKWLEVIRSRKVMGLEIASLRHIIAAMNPPTVYAGAIPLDVALAGRFGFIVPMPELRRMGAEDLVRIMTHVGADDAPLLAKGEGETAAVGLAGFLDRARGLCGTIKTELGAVLVD